MSFSYAPLRFMSYLGMILSVLGCAYAILIIALRLTMRAPIQGYASLMVAVLVMGGVQMMMLGILGEYLWRTLEAARHRPIYFLEETSESEAAPEAPKEERSFRT